MERDMSGCRRWTFFATCGRGMEPYVSKELWGSTVHSLSGGGPPSTRSRPLFSCVESAHDGKVFFELLDDTDCHRLHGRLSDLKSVERVFVSVARHEFNDLRNVGAVFQFVKQTCSQVADTDRWRNGFTVWSRLAASIGVGQQQRKAVLDNAVPAVKRLKESYRDATDDSLPSEPSIAFRISSKCSGRISGRCPPQRLTGWIANSVERHLAGTWTPNTRNPDLEVYAHLNDEYLIIGFVIPQKEPRQPLSKRPYLDTIGLRPTVCWAMAYAAQIKQGDAVLDPMCGVGTLLVEAVVSYPEVGVAVGVDIDRNKLVASARNVQSSCTDSVVHLTYGSVRNLPLRDDTFDVVLCDFPFGLMVGTKSVSEARRLLPEAVLQIDRVCREGARIVFLLSLELYELLIETVTSIGRRSDIPRQTPSVSYVPRSVSAASARIASVRRDADSVRRKTWKRFSMNRLKLGDLEACIVVHVVKTSTF